MTDNVNAAKEIVEVARIIARGRESIDSLMALNDFSIKFNTKVLEIYEDSENPIREGLHISDEFEGFKVKAEDLIDEMQDLMDKLR